MAKGNSSTAEGLLLAGAESERSLVLDYMDRAARATTDKTVRETLRRMMMTIEQGGHRHGL